MKNTNYLVKTILVLLTAGSMAACSKGFQADSSSSGADGTNNGQTIGGGSTPLESVDFDGYADGGDAENSMVISLDKQNMSMTLSVPITIAGLALDVSASIPQYPDILVYTYVDSSSMKRLAVKIPLKYILRGVSFGNPQSFPNGLPIPFIGGELPSTSLVINTNSQSKLYLYIGSGAVALYVSHPSIPNYITAYYNIRNKSRTKVIGAVGISAKTALADGGFVVSTKIPAELAKILDNYLGSL